MHLGSWLAQALTSGNADDYSLRRFVLKASSASILPLQTFAALHLQQIV
jgi:hypothetical protein